MRVEDKSRIATGKVGANLQARPNGADFKLPAMGGDGAESPQRAGQVAGSAPLTNLDALMSLQGMEIDRREKRQKQVRRGGLLLDQLDRLKIGLLEGRVTVDTVKHLADLAREAREETGDAGLDGVLAQIEIRAQVEMAKLEAMANPAHEASRVSL